MIEILDTDTVGQIEMRMGGTITATDYDNVLTPAIELALVSVDAIRLLVLIDEDTSFEIGAAWSDMKLGLSYWRGFDRVAVCAGSGWVASMIQAFAAVLPCPVQVFDPDKADVARRWLRESLGAIHLRDLGGSAFRIDLIGQVSPEDYALAKDDLDAKLRELDGFRLLIDLREFDGWQGLSAMVSHFALARGHVDLLNKAAIVGDKAWQKMAQRIGSRLISAETRFFDAAQFEQAESWLVSSET